MSVSKQIEAQRPAIRRRVPRQVAVVALLSAALAGCGTLASPLPPIEDAPEPAPPPAPAESDIYRLRVGDVVDLKFLLSPELNEELTIGPDGRVSTFDAENIPVAGRRASDVAADLRIWYKRLLKEPRLSVTVHKYAQAPVFVGGEVVSPGEFLSDGLPLTLSQAVARSGGIKLGASPSQAFVIRRGPDDKPTAYAIRYDQVMRGAAGADVRLAPYDLVYLPRTSVAEAFVYFNQYVQQFLPVSWGFSYQINPEPGSYPSSAVSK